MNQPEQPQIESESKTKMVGGVLHCLRLNEDLVIPIFLSGHLSDPLNAPTKTHYRTIRRYTCR